MGSGGVTSSRVDRSVLRTARKLLKDAGWTRRRDRLTVRWTDPMDGSEYGFSRAVEIQAERDCTVAEVMES